MSYEIKITNSFKKDLKKAIKRGLSKEKLNLVVKCLMTGQKLGEHYKYHQLITDKNYKNARECHIEPDWLLIYCIDNDFLILTLVRTGSHSDLF